MTDGYFLVKREGEKPLESGDTISFDGHIWNVQSVNPLYLTLRRSFSCPTKEDFTTGGEIRRVRLLERPL